MWALCVLVSGACWVVVERVWRGGSVPGGIHLSVPFFCSKYQVPYCCRVVPGPRESVMRCVCVCVCGVGSQPFEWTHKSWGNGREVCGG